MLPLYRARIEDLRRADIVQVDCAACRHVALLTPDFLLRLGLSPQAKVPDLKSRVRCRGWGARGRAVVSVKWGDSAVEARPKRVAPGCDEHSMTQRRDQKNPTHRSESADQNSKGAAMKTVLGAFTALLL